MNRSCLFLILSLALWGCTTEGPSPPVKSSAAKRPASVPFEYAGPLLKVPVRLNDKVETLFIFDTGIGVHLISRSLAATLGCEVSGRHTGKRMSGQEVTVPMGRLASLSLASGRQESVAIGVWDMKGFLPDSPDFEGVEGFLSLNFFKERPFTLDYRQGRLILEDEAGLAAREQAGRVVPLTVKDDGASVTIFFSLAVPGGPPAKVELDLGSNILILDDDYRKRLGVEEGSAKVRIEEAKDETGNPYRRTFTKIAGPIHPEGAPKLAQQELSVMFQDIIYDGLVGNDFMKRFTVTYDLPRSRLIFAERE